MALKAAPIARYVRHAPALEFTIVAEVHEHRVDYTVFDVEGWAEGRRPGVYDSPQWHRAGSERHPDPVATLDEAEPFLHGAVKWDGCSDWHFDEQERAMLHGCSRGDVLRFGEVMALCWDWTAELCPGWRVM